MKLESDKITRIYSHIKDGLSKTVFEKRVLYSLTDRNNEVMKELASTCKEINSFFQWLDGGDEIYVYGCGYRGKQLISLYPEYKWKGFVDKKPTGKCLLGLPIHTTDEYLNKYFDSKIVISSRLYYKEMYEALIAGGVKETNIFNYGELLEKLLQNQYFDLEQLDLNEEYFVDLGCWDAFTDIVLKKKIGDKLKHVLAFEPDNKQLDVCRRNLAENNINSTLVAKGAWSSETELHFFINGTMLTESEEGQFKIPVTTVDSVASEDKVTYIKMDIEGSELEAIRGCEKIIREQHPKLAICVYHKMEDVQEIPALVLDYYDGYDLFFRHYSPFDVETVMYAIPRKE